jgi:thioredoxin 1
MVSPINTSGFKSEVLDSKVPVIVDFWAEWCMPCRMIEPVVEELNKEYNGKVKFFKLNTDKDPSIAIQYQIMSIPTLLFFKNGRPVDKVVGVVPKKNLMEKIKNIL